MYISIIVLLFLKTEWKIWLLIQPESNDKSKTSLSKALGGLVEHIQQIVHNVALKWKWGLNKVNLPDCNTSNKTWPCGLFNGDLCLKK